jgi:hypothetical protein
VTGCDARADDGGGGADPDRGTGLRGLIDRVSALGGRLRVDDASGGTRLVADIPAAQGELIGHEALPAKPISGLALRTDLCSNGTIER